MDKSKDQDRERERWSRTSRIKVAILACQVNWGIVMRMKELKDADANLPG
jgi:hypothetical protein